MFSVHGWFAETKPCCLPGATRAKAPALEACVGGGQDWSAEAGEGSAPADVTAAGVDEPPAAGVSSELSKRSWSLHSGSVVSSGALSPEPHAGRAADLERRGSANTLLQAVKVDLGVLELPRFAPARLPAEASADWTHAHGEAGDMRSKLGPVTTFSSLAVEHGDEEACLALDDVRLDDCPHSPDDAPERASSVARLSSQVRQRLPSIDAALIKGQAMPPLPPLPHKLHAMKRHAARPIHMAARVHKGATAVLLLPRQTRLPTPEDLERCGLCHPPDVKGWYPLTDGSAMALLRLKVDELTADGDSMDTWVNHGQAKALHRAQIRIVQLLEAYVPVDQRAELNKLQLKEYFEVVGQKKVPGLRAWPLSDVLVSRVLTLNIAGERCRSCSTLFRLDRGARYLDLIRLHYGEETSFLIAWQSHYLHCLCLFVVLTIPFIVPRTFQGKGHIDRSMVFHSLMTIIFGVTVTDLWAPWVKQLVHRWHAHGDSTTRWHHLTVSLIEAAEKANLTKQMNNDRIANSDVMRNILARAATHRSDGLSVNATRSLEESAKNACRSAVGWGNMRKLSCRSFIKLVLKMSIVIPAVLIEWASILLFFTAIVWFEIWVIFDWGGCHEFNVRMGKEEWECVSADTLRGYPGVVLGALPSILEGVFFELLLGISKFTANSMMSLFKFQRREQRDYAVVLVVFLLEVLGKVGFISVLGLGFVPSWSGDGDQEGCKKNWDYWLLGDKSLGCLKGLIPFTVRLKLMESAMKGPMLVSGLVGIFIKTLLPYMIERWRKGIIWQKMGFQCLTCRCRRFRVIRCIMAPTDFILRTSSLIFQADCGAVGGLRMLCKMPPHVASSKPLVTDTALDVEEQEERREAEADAPPHAAQGPASDAPAPPGADAAVSDPRENGKRQRLQEALCEGARREHEPFDEYIELLLHFLWISCFAIVWPLGCVFALANQFLEFRFDCMKLLYVRRRRWPSHRHMSVAWVPSFALIVCHVSIVVNICVLLLPYSQMLIWYPEGCRSPEQAEGPERSEATFGLENCGVARILGAFFGTWFLFLFIRFSFSALVAYILRYVAKARCLACLGSRSPDAVDQEHFEQAASPSMGMRDPAEHDAMGMRTENATRYIVEPCQGPASPCVVGAELA